MEKLQESVEDAEVSDQGLNSIYVLYIGVSDVTSYNKI